jgi:CRP-like cAMP-binding protein
MNTFLTKISQLKAIREVTLLSLQGGVLFRSQTAMLSAYEREAGLWKAIIDDLGWPVTAELLFSKGRYHLQATGIGILIVGMTGENSLKKIRVACANVQAKLVDPAVQKKVLLKMLSDGEEMSKAHLVDALIPLADNEVAQVLLSLVRQEETFGPDFKEHLLLALCRALGHCAGSGAIPALQNLLLKYSSGVGQADRNIKEAATLAIRQLESAEVKPVMAGASARALAAAKESRDLSDPLENLSEGSRPEEAQIKDLLDQGQKRQAVDLIMQFITKSAKEKRFEEAEQLRNWLMRIDSMALIESIRAAEIIEEEKRASISDECLQTWKDLTESLSPEEFSSLYHAATPRDYPEGEMVAQQGEFLSILFFINSGRVQLNAISQGREIPLKVLGPGEILGSETFFDASVWTVNAISQGASLSLLTWQKLEGQKENCPALRTKLQDFCLRFSSPSRVFIKSSRTRRQSERKKTPGRVTINLLDQQDKETGLTAKGELLDLSKKGVALSLRFSKKKNAAALLGQKIRVNIRADGSAIPLQRIGKVMAVRCHDFIGNDYSLHVEFDVELASAEFQQAVSSRGR